MSDTQHHLHASESPLASLVRSTSSRRTEWQADSVEQRYLRHVQRESEDQELFSASNSYAHQGPSQLRDQTLYVYNETYGVLSTYHWHDSSWDRSYSFGHDFSLKVYPADTDPTFQIEATSPPSGPASPLLHGRFIRESFATTSSDANTTWDQEPSEHQYRRTSSTQERNPSYSHDTYSQAGEVSGSTSNVSSTIPLGPIPQLGWKSELRSKGWDGHDLISTGSSPPNALPPNIVVSAENAPQTIPRPQISALRDGPGRAFIVNPVTRDSTQISHSEGQRATPQLPPDMKNQKLKVLERNAARQQSEGGVHHNPGIARQINEQPPKDSKQIPSTTTRASSPLSLYSMYSYYSYKETASPLGGDFQIPQPREPPSKQEESHPGPRTPQDYLQLGIQHHEANRLTESAQCFERAANEGGGCGVGMLMYGLTLRHGWGCAKNEKMGFKWLMKAAEYAVGDLEKVRTGVQGADPSVLQSELVLAIYEVGQCFFHGWGVTKDQKMAVVRRPSLGQLLCAYAVL